MSHHEEAPRRMPRLWISALAIAVAAMLPFSAALGADFVYDDFVLIVRNELVRGFKLAELWTTQFFHNSPTIHFQYFRPLVTTSFAIDWSLWGGHAGGFHATNLLIHAAVTCLVFLTLRRWTGRDGAALLATLVWTWHPTKTEPVVWIAGRTDLLCTFGLLLATLGAARRFRGLRFGLPLEILGTLVAFSSKEMAIVLPGLVAVEAWVAAGRPALGIRSVARAIGRALPHGGLAAAYLVARALILPIESKELAHSQTGLDVVLFAVETWGETAKSLVWPWPLTTHRAPIYIDEAKNFIHDPTRIVLGVLTILALVGAVVATLRRKPLVAVGLLLAVFLFLPVANLRPTRMPLLTAERFLYLPSLGLALALAAILPRRDGALARAVYGGVALALAGGVAMAALHTQNFLNERKFWTHELEVHPTLPAAIHARVRQTLAERNHEEALELSWRGYQNGRIWTIAHPFEVEFALYAAQITEATTLDSEAASLASLAAFYRAFFIEKDRAELVTKHGTFVAQGGKAPAAWLRKVAPSRVAEFQAIGARALARAGDCDGALTLAKEAAATPMGATPKTTTVLVLARCEAWDEALALAGTLPEGPARAELVANLQASREALTELGDADDLDAAVVRSRIGTLLLDRKRAFSALVAHEEELLADPQGALYFARVAWAAGEDEAARRALAKFVPEQERTAMLATWSRELGRK